MSDHTPRYDYTENTKEEFITEIPSDLPDVEYWEVVKEQHYVLNTGNLCIPLPTLYSVVGVLDYGRTKPYKTYVLENIDKHIKQVEKYFHEDLMICENQDLRHTLDQIYGELW